MVGSFLGVAGVYILLHAELVAAAQVLIYVGAISVLVIFAIMLTGHRTGDIRLFFHKQAWIAAPVCAIAGIALIVVMSTADFNATARIHRTRRMRRSPRCCSTITRSPSSSSRWCCW